MTFTFRPRAGGRMRADIATAADGPHVWLSVTNTRGEHAAVFIPLANVEEVVAGIRGTVRPSGGAPPTAVLAPAERQFLTFALDLAADHMANRGDEFDDEDDAALSQLRQLAAEGAGA
ncbi:hypothetical protein [Streptomyces virginiae]|uniref:hypothetical protein n=1 Tax=Streptomyces virginiae TaxID=1961 RepID=UPI003788FB7A